MARTSVEIRTSVVSWFSAHPRIGLTLLVLAALLPCLSKPFNMDDPLFIWAAKHIRGQPFNPYGFEVNWYGSQRPMWEVTKNPPLACYYLAAVGSVLGWSEVALHAVLVAPAVAVILGTYRLARRLGAQPIVASVMTLFTPAFLVSSATVMCDTLMMAFWIWAVVFWVEGFARGGLWKLFVAGGFICVAGLTKYYGIALVPLLAAYGLIKARRPGGWCLVLLLPVLTMAAYDYSTRKIYGRTLLLDAATYASVPAGIAATLISKFGSGLTALDFAGGCVAVGAFIGAALLPRRILGWTCAGTILFAVVLFWSGALLKDYRPIEGSSRLGIEAQIVFWAIGGAAILALTASELWARRDAETWLLALWIFGTFIFAAVFNWTVNGRSIVPMVPAIALLIARRLRAEEGALEKGRFGRRYMIGSFAAGILLAALVLRSDYLFAVTAWESARQTYEKYGKGNDRFWFQGHWGFQYYMRELGAVPLDEGHTDLRRGDFVAVPVNNANYSPFKPELVVMLELLGISGPRPRFITTMKGEVGAGFYASNRGPLPFAFGAVPEEKVVILALEPQAPPPSARKR